MIQVDISNVWGELSLPDLLAIEKEVAAAWATLSPEDDTPRPVWLDLPVRDTSKEIARMEKAAEKIRGDSDVCVVVGIGGSYRGGRAAVELLQGPNRNLTRGKPQIFYAGQSPPGPSPDRPPPPQ